MDGTVQIQVRGDDKSEDAKLDDTDEDDDEIDDNDDERNAALESFSINLGCVTQLNLSISTAKTSVAKTCVQMFSVSLFQAKAD